jgi:hypothetical protein
MRGVAVLLFAGLACLPRARDGDGPRETLVRAEGAAVRIVFGPADAESARQVAEVLPGALARAQRWGRLAVPVTVTLHADHEALETAVSQEGYPWMRGWARYASIDLQSPRSWELLGTPDDAYVGEVLAHELTHCVLYQVAASDWSWAYKGIPLWFREGMASVTAGQGHRREGLERIARFYDEARPALAVKGAAPEGGRGDPLSDPEPLYRREDKLVYSTAHHAFDFLLARYGEGRVRAVLAEMGAGHRFDGAFERALGLPPRAFEADFRRYAAWRGWSRR